MTRRKCRETLRFVIVGTVLCVAVVPVLPLVASALNPESTRPLWTDAFRRSVQSTLWLSAAVSVLSLVAGLPLGLLAALYRFPARWPLVVCQSLPLLLPSFLPSIGWSNLAAASWLSSVPTPGAFAGCVGVLGLQLMPLPFFATWAACQNLTASQIEAARLHGGEKSVLALSARSCGPVAVVAALFGGVLSLSDPGAPLIFGYRTVAVEIRTSFSALFDYQLAGRQCLLLAGLALLLTVPVLFVGLRRLSTALLARQTRPAVAHPHRLWSRVALVALLSVLAIGIVLPTLGLCLPAARNPMTGRAVRKLAETAVTTTIYTGGAGIIAVVCATTVALAASAGSSVRIAALVVLLVLLAFPPALAAIGVSQIATAAPPEFDWLTRSRLTVALVLGLRFLPVATLMMMRAVGCLPPSWTDAARLHGIATPRRLARVILPNLASAIVTSLLLVIVLAAADITTTHLLQPPGHPSLPVAIFTVMANSPEGLVASLCLLYLLCVALLLAVASALARLWSERAA